MVSILSYIKNFVSFKEIPSLSFFNVNSKYLLLCFLNSPESFMIFSFVKKDELLVLTEK